MEEAIIYNPEMLVVEELYPWGSQTLEFKNPKVYLHLSNFESIEDKLGDTDDDYSDHETKATKPLVMSKKKKDEADVKENFNTRLRRNFILYIFQTGTFIALMVLWLTSVMTARDILAYNFMNRSIISKTTGERSAFDETYSTYITTLQQTSYFFRVKQPEDILPFIASIESVLFYIGYTTNTKAGTIEGLTKFFPYVQLRQIRSEVDDCDFPEFDIDKKCARELNGHLLTNDIVRNGYVAEYKDGDTRAAGVSTGTEIFSLGGNVIELPALNYTEYIQDSQATIELDWITLNTRYTSFTVNYFNPSLSAYTCMVYSFIFDLEQDIVPSYHIITYYYEFYSPGETLIAALLMLCSMALIILSFRDATMHPEEIAHMSEAMSSSKAHTTEEMKKSLAEWEEYDKKRLKERCHRLDILSFVAAGSAVGIIILVITHFVWFYSFLKEEFDVSNTEYNDLVFISLFYNALVICQGIITILLSVGVLKYSQYWIRIMAMMVRMIITKVEHFFGFWMVCVIGIIGFAMYFFGVLGPYEYRAALNYLILEGVSRLFVGRWFTTDVFIDFISVWYVILPIIAFMYFKMTIITLSIINLQWQFMRVKEGLLNRSIDEPKTT